MTSRSVRMTLLVTFTLAATGVALAQQKHKYGYTDTPMLPGGKWHVHDSNRPLPLVVDPGTASTQDKPGQPPSDAVVLFDGKDLSKWRSGNGPAKWKVEEGAMVAVPGSGTLESKEEFGDCQLHVEWMEPVGIKGSDQGRGNSGVIIMGRYEIQVLDCYKNETYADGGAGAIYGQYPPLVNACRPQGQWQTYDISFTAPRFKANGDVETPAYVTLFHNGVLVQNHVALLGPMVFRALAKYTPHGPKGPLALQDHGNPVHYRNIWYRPLKPVNGD